MMTANQMVKFGGRNRFGHSLVLQILLYVVILQVGLSAGETTGGVMQAEIKGNPPLLNAAMRNDVDAILKLLQEGTGIDATNKHGQTALMWASTYGASNVVGVLIEKGCDIKLRDTTHQATALIYAAGSGHKEIVRRLLDHGADLNVRDQKNQTPLIYAALGNRLDVLRLLVSRKADLNAQDKQGMTALMWASMLQSREAVRILVAAGANVLVTTPSGMKAVDFAASEALKAELTGKGDR